MTPLGFDFTSFVLSFGTGVFVALFLMRWGCPFQFSVRSKMRQANAFACCGEPLKMTLVVRRDLKMGTGKIAAQCAHAAVAVMEEVQSRRSDNGANCNDSCSTYGYSGNSDHYSPAASQMCGGSGADKWVSWYDAWRFAGSKKVALQCENEEQLMEAYRAARREGIPHAVIRDAGRTQIAAGSKTVLAVGPAPDSLVDRVTGHFKLL
ncbi:hypothetical protein, conserved [Trypanosoma brucei brucei TREU927]|uniref:peptidyl-tRNA hydrolase n=1 Tax=Trypanosoma brucei brucei (strain 927/4 GUTat10.1) TaxID=185431 RepID=Q582G7_TRYB2|nr:hypothetical protein, conserved [Trypanosoma brucei brucei TREU927]AAX78864.1 hypothetical protein, conserved [Trypanosoma brucei]AAZ12616.1 hypothetical protein, conserved [Trypanosoma brucei brucei TREU927]